jgi:predicted metalloendopeptidase
MMAFFSWTIQGEPVKDPTFATPWLQPDGLGLPNKDYYTDKDETDFYRTVVADALVALAAAEQDSLSAEKKQRKPESEKKIRARADAVVELEIALAAITPENEDLEDPLGTYNPTSFAELSRNLSSLEVATYFHDLGAARPESINVLSPRFVRRLDSLISRTPDDVLEAYLVWTAMRTLGLALGPNVPLRRPLDALDRRSKGIGADATEDRATFCQNSLNDVLGFLTGRFFVADSFPPQSKEKAELIIHNIIRAFKSRLPELAWLDDATRARAERKADAIRIKVGWPESPQTKDAGAMERFYADFDVKPKDFFGNVARSLARGVRHDWAAAGKTLDAKAWEMIPSEVNAYYTPLANEIVFPAGILQPAYFSYRWTDALQYGAFGS